MLDLEFGIEGDVQFKRRLLIVADGLTDYKTPLLDVGQELRHSFDQNFAQRGSLFGGWKPRTKPYPWPLLENTGSMRHGFQQSVGSNFVKLYNTQPYFKYHQSNQPRRKIPRRVMMKIDRQRKTYIVKAFQLYIVNLTRGKK